MDQKLSNELEAMTLHQRIRRLENLIDQLNKVIENIVKIEDENANNLQTISKILDKLTKYHEGFQTS